MMTSTKPPVADNIRRLREANEMTKRDLALWLVTDPHDELAGDPDPVEFLRGRLKTPLRNVQRWERGDVVPSWPQMVRLSDALGVEPYELWVTA